MATAQDIIDRLGLTPHPEEGGFFREMYRADESHAAAALPARYGADRAFGTAIYYLLTPETFSALHRLASDEVFHFYGGDPVEQLHLHEDGRAEVHILGGDVLAGQQPLCVVPRGVWQGARLRPGGAHGWALLGATVAPGFAYADYEHGDGPALARGWPDQAALITALSTAPGPG